MIYIINVNTGSDHRLLYMLPLRPCRPHAFNLQFPLISQSFSTLYLVPEQQTQARTHKLYLLCTICLTEDISIDQFPVTTLKLEQSQYLILTVV